MNSINVRGSHDFGSLRSQGLTELPCELRKDVNMAAKFLSVGRRCALYSGWESLCVNGGVAAGASRYFPSSLLAANRRREATYAVSTDGCDNTKQLDFSDYERAFKPKTTWELLRALLVYRICSFDMIVKNNKKLIALSRKIFGKKGFEFLMKSTFYGHFVAGEDQNAIKDKLALMKMFGVSSILDYAVEADIPKEYTKDGSSTKHFEDTEQKYEVTDLADIYKRYLVHKQFDRRDRVYSARTYYYEGEEKCDENMEVFLKCIETTGNTAKDGFAAIKVTALGRPAILLRLSQILNQTQYYFDQMAVSSNNALKFEIALQNFKDGIKNLGVDMTDLEAEQVFRIIDVNQDNTIDAIEWQNFLTPQLKLAKLFRAKPVMGKLGEPIIASLTDTELKEMENMAYRLLTIADRAKEKGVRLMVDAEQTYFQPAISRITLEAMRLFNRERPVVMNTYQCYLKQTCNQLAIDMELARREGFYFGAKLVRGAYMEQERKRANELGYEDPILPDYEATNVSYNKSLAMVLEEVRLHSANVMVATHNEDSVKYTVEKMKEMNMEPTDGKVFFGQLLGMCDAVTFALGQAGFAAYKYVPYGPVDEVMPYLSRRAMENRSLMKGVLKERQMLWNELRRRVRERQLFHNPAAAVGVRS